MNHRNSGSTIIVRMMCAIVFLTFTFLFVYRYQAPTLEYVQHVLSGGQTHYAPLIGGIIITAVAQLLQSIVYRFLRLSNASYSLTYVPSMLLLILLTDIIPYEHGGGFSVGTFYYFLPLVLLVYAILLRLAKQWIRVEKKGDSILSSEVIVANLLTMVITMGSTLALANGNQHFMSVIRANDALTNADYETIIKETDKVSMADTTLTTYRCIALDRRNSIGDSLFHAPVTGSLETLTNMKGVYPLTATPKVLKRTYYSPAYLLSGLLLERDIDRFARNVKHFYTINDSLPQHFKEALVLYQHLRSNPVTDFKNEIMETDYDGVQEIIRNVKDANERNAELYRTYRKTYWAYYFRGKNQK